jgi:polar amino acid transport system permease protein
MFTTSLTWNDVYFLLQGAGVTLVLTCLAMLVGTAAGLLSGLSRAFWPRATWPLAAVLDVFRSVPLIIQFVLLNSFKSIIGLDWTAFTVATIVLGCYVTAYFTEIVRSGVLAVPQTTRRAARSLGMTFTQDVRYIVVPIAARVAFPGWINLTLAVMKDTSLVLWIGIVELLRASQTIVTRLQEPLFVLMLAGLIYYGMSLVVARCGTWVETKWQEND